MTFFACLLLCGAALCFFFFSIFWLMYDGIYPCLRAASSFISRNGKKKKKTLEKSLLLSIMIIIKKIHKFPMLWEMSLSLSHFLWCVNLSLNFTLTTSTQQMQKCHMKKNKHLGAIVFFLFYWYKYTIYIYIIHMRLNYILLPVLCYVKWQLFQSCVLL